MQNLFRCMFINVIGAELNYLFAQIDIEHSDVSKMAFCPQLLREPCVSLVMAHQVFFPYLVKDVVCLMLVLAQFCICKTTESLV